MLIIVSAFIINVVYEAIIIVERSNFKMLYLYIYIYIRFAASAVKNIKYIVYVCCIFQCK